MDVGERESMLAGYLPKRYRITLTPTDRTQLLNLIAAGPEAAPTLAHARVLLKADEDPDGLAWTDDRIVGALEVSGPTVEGVRRRGSPSRGSGAPCWCTAANSTIRKVVRSWLQDSPLARIARM